MKCVRTRGGRSLIVKKEQNGSSVECTPADFNVRTRVHEFGGVSYAVHQGCIYFCNFSDGRVYCQKPDAAPYAISPEGAFYYADFVVDHKHHRLICVREDRTAEDREPENAIVAIPFDGDQQPQVLCSGCDFYSYPRLSCDGSLLAWICWNHPNMPWDGTELYVADIGDDGALRQPAKIAGGEKEAVFQPLWGSDGTLFFVSDKTNWWNLYSWKNGEVNQVIDAEAEFGMPLWVFGMSCYAELSNQQLAAAYTQKGSWYLTQLNTAAPELEPLVLPFNSFKSVKSANGKVYCIASSTVDADAVIEIDPASGEFAVLRKSIECSIDDGYISKAEAIEFPTSGEKTAHAFFYPPLNKDYAAKEAELPPLLVLCHGGPTGATESSFNLKIQYWTSRGFGVLDVNYGGSTGYGREYRRRLDGNWGIVDVDDCCNGAEYLAALGRVDRDRLIMRGGSAGGFTTLSALTFRDLFKAGASFYGISDLEALVADDHKFESRYFDRLIGPYPQHKQLYIDRSPIHKAAELNCPMIFFQGLEDKIVPANQAEMMVQALKKKGVPVAYLPFPGEGHGFRNAKHIKRALEAELYFYAKIFGFEADKGIAALEIFNLAE